MLRTYRTYNSKVGFSKFEFNNKLLGGVTLSNVTPPNNLLLNSYFENLTVEFHYLYVFHIHVNLTMDLSKFAST